MSAEPPAEADGGPHDYFPRGMSVVERAAAA
jgi:hypothetical protein